MSPVSPASQGTWHTLLIVTVGGSRAPVVAAILHSRPKRVLFLCSADSVKSIEMGDEKEESISATLAAQGFPLPVGAYEAIVFADPQDLIGQVQKIRRSVSPEVSRWAERGSGYRVVVDFTGGTKCMSVAVALFSRRWPCLLEYVGGTERTKNNVGVVVSGREQVLHFARPWEVLGWELAERAVALYGAGDLGAAEGLLREAAPQISEPTLRKAVETLQSFLLGLLQWDRFDHANARNSLRKAAREIHSVAPLLSEDCIDELGREVPLLVEEIEALIPAAGKRRAGIALVRDLMGNAARRMREERFDDATGRYYRAIEATAQWRLATEWQIESTALAPWAMVPAELREGWEKHRLGETLTLGLQDAFRLLAALGDEYGVRFHRSGLAGACQDWRSPEWGLQTVLAARNNSILAHGFEPIGGKVALQLRKAAEIVTGVDEGNQIRFPKLEVA